MKVFVSLPMHGKTEEEILERQQKFLDILDEELRFDGEYEENEHSALIDTVHKPNAPKNASRLWYLGESIKLLDDADMVYFADNWYRAKGCWVEFIAAIIYDKRLVYDYPSNRVFHGIEDFIGFIFSLIPPDNEREEGKKNET